MDKHDVIRFMRRFPDKIINENQTKGNRLVSKEWKCSRCGKEYRFNEEVGIPAPCKECGDIFFEIIRSPRKENKMLTEYFEGTEDEIQKAMELIRQYKGSDKNIFNLLKLEFRKGMGWVNGMLFELEARKVISPPDDKGCRKVK
ncbi:hypothetical protein [uncultured Tissierella sp.]|uniref:hypothetical protein n=1 Tax=uncultured Tissierella sp. TaxID=448160 RepID=UPI0028038271|nr:hypothetical protein [uncultured Tissierella sp.]MDU5080254.1 hypothetical protein [Bacillota bacterium]